VNLGFKLIGTAIALAPAARGVRTMMAGNVEGGAEQISYDYIGVSKTGFDPAKATTGIGFIIAGIVLMKLGSYVARRL